MTPRLHETVPGPKRERREAPAPQPADPKRKPRETTNSNDSTYTDADTAGMEAAQAAATALRLAGDVASYVVDTPGAVARVVGRHEAMRLLAAGTHSARLTPAPHA